MTTATTQTASQTRESVHSSESAARAARRSFKARGLSVSLLAYDPARDAYVFDVYGR